MNKNLPNDDSSQPYDLLVIGGGVVGLAILRHATLQGYKTCLIEKEAHLLCHASGHNSGVLCTGVDAQALERALIRDSISNVRAFYKQMNLPSRPCGSLVCRYAWQDQQQQQQEDDPLKHVLNDSLNAGDTNAKRLTPVELQALEPHLTHDATAAVHIPGETVVDPFLHSVAYAVQARQHGAVLWTNCAFDSDRSRFDELTRLWTVCYYKPSADDCDGQRETGQPIVCKAIVCAAGIWGDQLQQTTMGVEPSWKARPIRGQYLVYQSPTPGYLKHPIQPIPTTRTKGIFVFSTLYDQIVVGPTATDQESRTDDSICHGTREQLKQHVRRILPELSDDLIVGEYVGIRPGTNHRDYQMHLNASRAWLNCCGIRSTGLTASLGIGRHVVSILETAGVLVRPQTGPTIQTKPLPSIETIVRDYQNSEDGSITIDGHSYKVTHPLTRFGLSAGTGIASPTS